MRDFTGKLYDNDVQHWMVIEMVTEIIRTMVFENEKVSNNYYA